MGADDDDRLILAALVAAYPAMVEIGALLDLDGVEHPGEAVQRLGNDGLAVRVGDLVGTSRTYRRARALIGSGPIEGGPTRSTPTGPRGG